MVAASFTREHVSIVSLDRLWKAGVLDGHNLIPKLLPDFVSSIELIEGDGGLGTVKKINYTEAVKEFRFTKEKTEVIDAENHILKLSTIEGGLIGQRLKSLSIELKFEVVNNSGTLAKIKFETDTINETPLSAEEEDEIVKRLFLMIKAIEGYLIENPASYA